MIVNNATRPYVEKIFDMYLEGKSFQQIANYFKENNIYLNKYCKDIKDRSESIQNNLNNFDKDIQKEKDNSRSL